MAAGLVLASIGFVILTQVDTTSGLATEVAGSVVLSLGMAPVFTLVTDMVLGSTAPERAGAASGIAETSTEFGGALGIALLGSIGAAVYRSQLAQAIPAGIPANAAGDTLGGALVTASHLPSSLSTLWLGLAREAFTNGLHIVAGLSAAIVAILAIFVIVLLRGIRSGGETSNAL
jgi:DHA2 family multidrug resistance protein-like MFS transporter